MTRLPLALEPLPDESWPSYLTRRAAQHGTTLAGLAEFAPAGAGQAWGPALRDAFLEVAYRAGSNDLFLPVQDLFGWHDRVNVPGTVGPENWTWAMPWPVDRLADLPECQDRAVFLRGLARTTERGPGPSAR